MGKARVERRAPGKQVDAGSTRDFEVVAFGILDGEAARILASIDVIRTSRDPEGPHQFRVGLRRWRTAVRSLGLAKIFPDLDGLSDIAKHLGRRAGALRDLEVIAAKYVEPAARANPGDPGLSSLLAEIEDRQTSTRAALLSALEEERPLWFIQAIRQGFGARAVSGDRTEAATDFVRVAQKALEHRWRGCRELAGEVEGLAAPELHELRKSAKKLRYLVEFAEPYLMSTGQAEFVTCLKEIQDAMGEVNDAAVAEDVLGSIGHEEGALLPGRRAARKILKDNVEAAHSVLRETERLWQSLIAVGPYWRA